MAKRIAHLSRRNRNDCSFWRNIPISNNVGGVKQFLRTLLSALIEERHFALVDGFARFQPWARFESSGSGTQSDPAISSITHCDQDSFIRTPITYWERDAQSLQR